MANYLFESGACALNFGEDGLGGGGPHVGGGIGVVGVDVFLDLATGRARSGTCRAAGFVGQVPKPAFDQVEPGRRGRGEVEVEPRVPLQPRPDLVVVVGA